ncbi:MAG: carboxypeptidase regulatory-like domain-containing protein [Pyrinomonadaceae bacterium]
MRRPANSLCAAAIALVFACALPPCALAQTDRPWSTPPEEGISVAPSGDDEQLADAPASATVVNGDFETGTLSGWTSFTPSTSNGSWRTHSGTTTPMSGSTIYAPPQGSFGAMADMTQAGNYVLYQDITLPTGQTHTLSFILYYSNRQPVSGNNNGFTEPSGTTLAGSQTYRVDLIKTTAAPDTNVSSDILANVFRTRSGDPESMRPTLITYDISAFAGQTVRLRFAAGVCCYYFYPGVDDVRITSNLVITGRVANAAGRAIPNAIVTLSGSQSATAITDPVGRYTFDNVLSGGNYTVTPSKSGYAFVPPSQAYTNLTASQTADFTATGGSLAPTAGQVLISRFRTRGALGANDEFIELYNNTDTDIVVSDPTPPASGATGWALVGGDSPTVARVIIPSGAFIPARGHYLVANTNDITTGYNLTPYAGADTGHGSDFTDGRGIALFRTANSTLFNLANRLDAVGFASETNILFFNGTPLQPSGGVTTNLQHVFMRRLDAGPPKNTGNNAADFVFISTTAAAVGAAQSVLGSPGPQNFSTNVVHLGTMGSSLINSSQPSTSSPNRVRDTRAFTYTRTSTTGGTILFPLGTLSIQRRFTNLTGAPVKRLRFRVIDTTSGPAPAGTADLRLLTSTGVVTDSTSAVVATVGGLKLEEPPNQDVGGGLNSTVRVGSIDLRAPLAPGASVDVQFLLGVQQGGSFRFFVLIEPLD